MAKYDPVLFKKIMEVTGKSERTVYRHISQVEIEHVLPPHQAILFLAIEHGIKIAEYASEEDMVAIRSAKHQSIPAITEPVPNVSASNQKRRVELGFEAYPDPSISQSDLTAARKNAELYPIVYIFENSVRNIVMRIMETEFGFDWWDEEVDLSIRKGVNARQKAEEHTPWHTARGAHPICYTDINDLQKIINMHYPAFKKWIGGNPIKKIRVWISEIEQTRNVLAHNNLVSKSDRNRLAQYARDWSVLATSVHDKINLES